MEANSAPPSSADAEEIERFSRIAGEWWNPNGKFRPLHRITPLRVSWIRDQILAATPHHQPSTIHHQLPPVTLLDIGCGGGLVAEPMARLGAKVVGIDASEKNIAVAKLHAEQSGLSLDYRCSTAETLVGQGAQFDVVLALEIIEHVADPAAFVASCVQLCKPGGLLVFSTLNRTPKSYALAIIGAEYVLRWLPVGTHTWSKFIRPSELVGWLRHNNAHTTRMEGMVFNPLKNEWRWHARDLSVNYILAAVRSGS